MKCVFANPVFTFKSSISDKEIDSFSHAKQAFSDCYLMSTLDTLSHTTNGRKILKENIQHSDNKSDFINCTLYKDNGQKELFSIPAKTAIAKYKKLYDVQDNKFVRAVDISVAEYEDKYKAKPWICRLTDNLKNYAFENNLPSHFMKIFTGVEPRVIAETDFNLDLTSYKSEVMELFKQMDKEKEHSFVIGTGVKMLDGRTWHVYVLEDVDLKNNTVTVKEKRLNQPKKMSIDTALNTFKYIVGYFNSDLAKTESLQ